MNDKAHVAKQPEARTACVTAEVAGAFLQVPGYHKVRSYLQSAIDRTLVGEVNTVKIDGSGWSKLTVLIVMKRAVSYRYGTRLPCQATTLNGLWPCVARQSWPP